VRPVIPAKNWCSCCCTIRTRRLVAVTSRQNAGQTLAQVFPKFASHPKSKTLRFVEPNAELLAKQADVVFLALPHGVAAEYAVPLINAGCVVIDLSADFRLKSAEIYKEFYAHDHPAPELLKKSVYGLPEIYRDEIKNRCSSPRRAVIRRAFCCR
jgi:N-acetyl-gamma-glutamyl-phosphate reductase